VISNLQRRIHCLRSGGGQLAADGLFDFGVAGGLLSISREAEQRKGCKNGQ
jgi:hypothetical protein